MWTSKIRGLPFVAVTTPVGPIAIRFVTKRSTEPNTQYIALIAFYFAEKAVNTRFHTGSLELLLVQLSGKLFIFGRENVSHR